MKTRNGFVSNSSSSSFLISKSDIPKESLPKLVKWMEEHCDYILENDVAIFGEYGEHFIYYEYIFNEFGIKSDKIKHTGC